MLIICNINSSLLILSFPFPIMKSNQLLLIKLPLRPKCLPKQKGLWYYIIVQFLEEASFSLDSSHPGVSFKKLQKAEDISTVIHHSIESTRDWYLLNWYKRVRKSQGYQIWDIYTLSQHTNSTYSLIPQCGNKKNSFHPHW